MDVASNNWPWFPVVQPTLFYTLLILPTTSTICADESHFSMITHRIGRQNASFAEEVLFQGSVTPL